MSKKVKLGPSDFDAKDFLSMFAEQVAAAVKQGVGKGLAGGGDLLSEIKNSLEEITKNEKESVKTAAIRQVSLDKQISAERVALVLATQQRKSELNALITQKQANVNMVERLKLLAEQRGDLLAAEIHQDKINRLQGDLAPLLAEKKELKLTSGLLYDKLRAQEELDEAQEKANRVNEKMHEVADALKTQIGLTEELRAQLSTPELAKAVFAEQIGEKMHEAYEGMEKFKESGLSAGQAVQAQFKGLSLASMLGLSDTTGALQGFAETYGSIGGVSSDVVDSVGQMAHHFGIAGAEAAKLNASLSQMPGETSETAADAMEMTGHMAEMQGIAPGNILKDMAANAESMALYSKGGAEGFGKAAIELHKMGVEIGTASKMADGLLDFENSINKQMEASALLGRSINLDKARELALNGDLEGSTREVLANIGGSAELEKMNVVQKKALAEATGLTVAELQKAADAQEEQNKYFGEGASALDNLIGRSMEWGAGLGGFLKENGLLLVSTMQLLKGTTAATKLANLAESAWNLTKKAGNALLNSGIVLWIKDKVVTVASYIATGIATVAQGAWNLTKKAGNAIMNSSVVAWIREKAVTVAGYIATGISTAAQGAWNIAKGVGNFLMATSIGMWIAEKVQIAASTVAKWLNVGANTAIATSATAAATATTASGTAAAGASGGFVAFGGALGAFGAAAAPAIPVILAIGAALLMASPALYVLGEVVKTIAQVIGQVLMKALEMIPPTITAIADGFVTIFSAVKDNIGAMLALGPALMMVGAGLGMIGTFGVAAMPVLAELVLLASVSAALVAVGSALGDMFGGGGGKEEGGEKEDKMQILIDEIRGLRTEMSKGGVVNMDGKKVGETLRLAMNTSGIR